MYIIDDICYAGVPGDEVRIVDAKLLVEGMILVLFSSGEKKLFDTTTLNGSAFLSLRDDAVFATLKVEHGFVSWADGKIDLAPEYIYENGLVYEEDAEALAG